MQIGLQGLGDPKRKTCSQELVSLCRSSSIVVVLCCSLARDSMFWASPLNWHLGIATAGGWWLMCMVYDFRGTYLGTHR